MMRYTREVQRTHGYISLEKRKELIKAVKEYPVIWNKDHSQFFNVAFKDQSWAKIAAAMQLKPDIARHIWDTLLYQYRREIRYSADQINYPNWDPFQDMHFLNIGKTTRSCYSGRPRKEKANAYSQEEAVPKLNPPIETTINCTEIEVGKTTRSCSSGRPRKDKPQVEVVPKLKPPIEATINRTEIEVGKATRSCNSGRPRKEKPNAKPQVEVVPKLKPPTGATVNCTEIEVGKATRSCNSGRPRKEKPNAKSQVEVVEKLKPPIETTINCTEIEFMNKSSLVNQLKRTNFEPISNPNMIPFKKIKLMSKQSPILEAQLRRPDNASPSNANTTEIAFVNKTSLVDQLRKTNFEEEIPVHSITSVQTNRESTKSPFIDISSDKSNQSDDIIKTETVVDIDDIQDFDFEVVSSNDCSNHSNNDTMQSPNPEVRTENGPEISDAGLDTNENSATATAINNKNWNNYPATEDVTKNHDDDYHFLMSILPTMRNIPIVNKLPFRIAIMNLLFEQFEQSKN